MQYFVSLFHFASAVVVVIFCQLIVSFSTLWSTFSPLSEDFVNGHVRMSAVKPCGSQIADLARPISTDLTDLSESDLAETVCGEEVRNLAAR